VLGGDELAGLGYASCPVTHDRITDPWGPRTPFACGGEWPVRVAAQGVRDRRLLTVVTRCEGETAIQLKWLRTRMKEAAPQALVVAR
jgi:hypothetical protein